MTGGFLFGETPEQFQNRQTEIHTIRTCIAQGAVPAYNPKHREKGGLVAAHTSVIYTHLIRFTARMTTVKKAPSPGSEN